MKKLSNAEILFKLISQQYNRGTPELKLTQMLYENNKTNPDVSFEYAQVLIQYNKFKEAIQLALELLEQNTHSPVAFIYGYRILNLTENKALEVLQKGEKLNNFEFIFDTLHNFGITGKELYLYFAFYYLENNQTKVAISIYEKLKRVSPNLFGLNALSVALELDIEIKEKPPSKQLIDFKTFHSILNKFSFCLEIDSKNELEQVTKIVKEVSENKNYPAYEIDFFKEYLTTLYEGNSKHLETIEIFSELRVRHPYNVKITEGLLRAWAFLQLEVEQLIKKDPNSSMLENYYKILQGINSSSNTITEAIVLMLTRNGRYLEAKAIAQNLLGLSPNKVIYLEMALTISQLAEDNDFKEEILECLEKITKKFPFLYYHKELLFRFDRLV